MIVQFVFNGIVTGVIISIIALGYHLVYKTTKIFHIAYAVNFICGSYGIFLFYRIIEMPLWISILLGMIVGILVSILIEILVYYPLAKKNVSGTIMMISSIGALTIIINIISIFFGNDTKILNPEVSSSIDVFSIIITYNQIYQLVIGSFVIGLFVLLLNLTNIGLYFKALGDDFELFKVIGLNLVKTRLLVFLFSGLLGTLGGILFAFEYGMDPYIGMPLLLSAVAAVIVGGIGNYIATIYGGMIIGLIQSLSVLFFSAQWQDLCVFVLLILILVFKPEGLFGLKKRII